MLPHAPVFGSVATEDDARQAGMHHRPHAHGAGLERDVELAAREPVVALRGGRLAQRDYFRVGGGIRAGDGAVVAAADDASVLHHDGAHRHLARRGRLAREGERLAHVLLRRGGAYSHSMVAGGLDEMS